MTDIAPSEAKAYGVPPVSRAIAVMRYIAAGNRCRNLSHAAKALGINRTTLIRILATLAEEDMIEEVPDSGGYRLGTSLIALAAQSLNERGILQVSRPVLRRLVDELKLSAHLGVIEGREIIYLARETPNSHLASMVREGTRLPAHATTIGRILLAQLPRAALHDLYKDVELPAYTDKTRTSLAALEEQLAADRARGVAWSVGFFEPEIGSASPDEAESPRAIETSTNRGACMVSLSEHVGREPSPPACAATRRCPPRSCSRALAAPSQSAQHAQADPDNRSTAPDPPPRKNRGVIRGPNPGAYLKLHLGTGGTESCCQI